VSVGTPIPGFELRVVDADLQPMPECVVGRIHVRGPSVMRGYFGNAPASAQAVRDGWLDTGDLGFVHQGELYLCGRAKELVILRGKNHAPQEFEDALDGLAGVRHGCAVALGFTPAGEEGEELTMLVERDETVAVPEAVLADAVRARVVERTGVRPHEVRLLAPSTLPRTSSGKLRRSEALRRLLAGELAPPRQVTPLAMLGEIAKSLAALARVKFGRRR
jgi:fatty-acyl-CoA synthase